MDDPMDSLTLLSDIARADDIYTWFEQQADSKTVLVVRACAVPVRFDTEMALHILESPALRLDGESPHLLAKIVRLPFVHHRPDGSYKYTPAARAYFDQRLRDDGVNYGELNRTIAEYLAVKRERRLDVGEASYSHSMRDLALREAYHTIPVDGESGMDKVQDFVETAQELNNLADTLAAIRVCEYQLRYIPDDRMVDTWYFNGRYHYLRNDYEAALPHLDRVRNSRRHTKTVAIADHFLGVIYRDQRRLDEAVEVLLESLQIGRKLEIELHIAMALNTLGTIYRDKHRLDEAVKALEEARDIFERLKDQSSKAMALTTLGTVYRDKHRLDEAVKALEEARDIFERLKDQSSKAIALTTLGTVYRDQPRLDKAVKALEEARDISERLKDHSSKAIALNTLGTVYRDQHRLDEAAKALEEARDISERLKDHSSKAMALNTLGTVYRDQHCLDEAAKALEEARDISERLKDHSSKAMALNTLGVVYYRREQYKDSEQVLLESREILRGLGDKRGVAMVCYSLGRLMERTGRLAYARAAYAQSEKMNNALGEKYHARKMRVLMQQVDQRLREMKDERQRKTKPEPPVPLPEGQVEERLRVSAEHLRTHSKDAQSRAGYILLLRRSSNIEKALDVAREGWDLTPNSAWLYTSYISILISLRRWREAKKVLRHRLQIVPDDINAQLTQGHIQERLAETEGETRQYQDAAATYRSVIASDNANKAQRARAWNGLGNVLKEIGDFRQAYECYQKAQSLGNAISKVWNNLGLLHMRAAETAIAAGDELVAEENLNHARDAFLRSIDCLESSERFVWPFMHLAQLCLTGGDWREAEDWLRQIDTSFPKARQDKEVRAKLQALWKELQIDDRDTPNKPV